MDNKINDELLNDITGVETNSRAIKKGNAFLALTGLNTDGTIYASNAIENGASVVVSEKPLDISVPNIIVKNTRDFLPLLLNKFYNNPLDKLKMIGVTGTDGKTSTTEIIYNILNNFENTSYMGTNGFYYGDTKEDLNNTTPELPIIYSCLDKMVKNNIKYAATEVGSHALDQGRVDGILYDIAIYTNLSHEHLDYHNTMEEYMKAKGLLFKKIKKDGFAIINIDDKYSDYFINNTNGKIITYGLNNDRADYNATDIKLELKKTSFNLNLKGKIFPVETRLLAEFNIYNILAAIAAIHSQGFNLDIIIKAIKELPNPSGRLDKIDLGQDYTVIVDYAHTPNGLTKLFDFSKTLKYNRTIIVLGSAGKRDKKKRPIMGEIVTRYSDLTIFTYEDPRNEKPIDIINDMISTIKDERDNYLIVEDREEAIAKAIELAEPGDLVLITGKGNESYEDMLNGKIAFNDEEMAYKYIKLRESKTKE